MCFWSCVLCVLHVLFLYFVFWAFVFFVLLFFVFCKILPTTPCNVAKTFGTKFGTYEQTYRVRCCVPLLVKKVGTKVGAVPIFKIHCKEAPLYKDFFLDLDWIVYQR